MASAISSVRRVASGPGSGRVGVEEVLLVLDVVAELVAHDDPRAHVAEAEGVYGVEEAVTEDQLVGDRGDGGVRLALAAEREGVEREERVVVEVGPQRRSPA